MHLLELKIKNFRQFGACEPIFSVQFHEGVTALVGENDVGKTAVIIAPSGATVFPGRRRLLLVGIFSCSRWPQPCVALRPHCGC